MAPTENQKINTAHFYSEYHGHPLPLVTTLHKHITNLRPSTSNPLSSSDQHTDPQPDKPIIYLAGDSSLDNKHWLPSTGPPIGNSLPVAVPEIYQQCLGTPYPRADIAFWVNHFLQSRGTCLNLAVEESTLRARSNALLEHDEFIRDHITEDDVLVVSVGGNDIALHPTIMTVLCMLVLAWLTPKYFLERGNSWVGWHFVHLFKTQTERYIDRLVEKKKPRAVVVCMIYYPLERVAGQQSSWADLPLSALGYNIFPSRLQAAIRGMYEAATRRVVVEGTVVRGCKLYECLDEKLAGDYESRVEPSIEGGRKMATRLAEIVGEFIPVVG